MLKQPFRRRRFILLDFQNRMLLFTFLYFVVTVVIFAAVLFIPLMRGLEIEGLSPEQRGIVAGEFLSLHYRFWPAIPFVLILLGAHSIIVSHRVAGPLHRFRKIFREVTDGDLTGTVRLRKNDYLKDDAELLSIMIDSLRSRLREIDYLDERLQTRLAELRTAVEGESPTEVRERLGDVESTAGKLRSDIQGFTIGEEQ
jgi:methyl-accepting chemotaxis protein